MLDRLKSDVEKFGAEVESANKAIDMLHGQISDLELKRRQAETLRDYAANIMADFEKAERSARMSGMAKKGVAKKAEAKQQQQTAELPND